MEFNHSSTLSRFLWPVDIDTIDDAVEPDTDRDASRKRPKHVTKEANSLRRIQLAGTNFYFLTADGDGCAPSRPQIADPLLIAPRAPDPTPARDLNDRHRRCAKKATLPAANVHQPIRA